jgi:hypothetical protein
VVANVIPLAIPEGLARISAGDYTAIYVRHAGAMLFCTPKMRVDFRILEHCDVVLTRWYRVTDYRSGRVRAGRHSNIVREISAVLGRRVRHDRIAVGCLAGLLVRVRVYTVTTDSRQNALADVNQYSAIETLLGRAEA